MKIYVIERITSGETREASLMFDNCQTVAVLTTRPKNGEISAQASLAALSPLIIKSKQKALLKTIKSLIKLYQMSTFPLNSIWSCIYLLVQKIFSWCTEFIINLFQFLLIVCVCVFFFFCFFLLLLFFHL